MGNKSFSAIVSIAAIRFDPFTGETADTFYERINLLSNTKYGLNIQADTVLWWLDQNEHARTELTKGINRDIRTVLMEFSNFIKPDDHLWGNSVRFDMGILENAWQKVFSDQPIPWNHYLELDVRTIVFLNPKIKKNEPRTGTHHNPLHDCYHQIKYISKTIQTITPQQNAPAH
jgi:hypothetical protein